MSETTAGAAGNKRLKVRRCFKALKVYLDPIALGLQILAVPFAIFYACVTYRQWHDIGRNFLVDQRAWVSAVHFQITLEVAEAFPGNVNPNAGIAVVQILLQNTGKTPAIEYVVQPTIRVSNQPPPCIEKIEPTWNANKGILPPNVSNFFTVAVSEQIPTELIRQYHMHMDKKDLYVYGLAQYKDIFGKDHWTQFCRFHHSGDVADRFMVCTSCNGMDH